MRLTVLVDNNTLTDSYFLAEPGLSLFIEEGDTRILFDAGYSDVLLTNAERKGIDLQALDWVILSHGHLDHTWGLDALINHRRNATVGKAKLLAHPEALLPKRDRHDEDIGILVDTDRLARHFDLTLSAEPTWLTDSLVMLGEIERTVDFETAWPSGRKLVNGERVPDTLVDDTSLAYTSENGLVVISGCAHAGICNTVEQARRITGVDKVHAVVGGFHLLNAPEERLERTGEYLGSLGLDALYACHCTDLAAKTTLARTCPLKEVGAGLTIEF